MYFRLEQNIIIAILRCIIKRFEQEKHKTIVRGLPYFEGATEEEFRKEFNDFLNDFFDKGDIDKKDKTIIKEFFMDYVQRLALNDVKEVRNEKNIGAGLGRLNPCPLRHHQKHLRLNY